MRAPRSTDVPGQRTDATPQVRAIFRFSASQAVLRSPSPPWPRSWSIRGTPFPQPDTHAYDGSDPRAFTRSKRAPASGNRGHESVSHRMPVDVRRQKP